ncbi:MAG: DUF4443 domain-containing protein [Candidatus Bathyarchaeia archaeon]
MKSLKVIEKVSAKLAPGQNPYFNRVHVFKALEILSAGAVGRVRLARELMLGEGTTRTLVKHLKNEGLIEISKSGIILSKLGKKVLSNLKSKISEGIEIPKSPLTVGPSNIAILIRNAANLVKNGVEQRDAAIKAGALGATTLIFKQGKLTIPGLSEDILQNQNIQSICNTIISKLKPKENDIIIIGSANKKQTAEIAAKTAALEILKQQNPMKHP